MSKLKFKNCEICKKKTFLENHHIISKSKGGTNNNSNIARICPTCHDLVHRGEIIIEGKFNSTQGLILLWHYKNDPAITNRISDVYLFS